MARVVMLGQQQNTILLYLFERSFLSCWRKGKHVGGEGGGYGSMWAVGAVGVVGAVWVVWGCG